LIHPPTNTYHCPSTLFMVPWKLRIPGTSIRLFLPFFYIREYYSFLVTPVGTLHIPWSASTVQALLLGLALAALLAVLLCTFPRALAPIDIPKSTTKPRKQAKPRRNAPLRSARRARSARRR
jgi:hypothetical protein